MYLKCHTFNQIAAGAAIGSITGVLWYLLFTRVSWTERFLYVMFSPLCYCCEVSCIYVVYVPVQ